MKIFQICLKKFYELPPRIVVIKQTIKIWVIKNPVLSDSTVPNKKPGFEWLKKVPNLLFEIIPFAIKFVITVLEEKLVFEKENLTKLISRFEISKIIHLFASIEMMK